MALSEQKLRRLRAEARQTYLEYGRIKRLRRAGRSDVDLGEHLMKLRVRYEELDHLLNDTPLAPEGAAIGESSSALDVSGFEPGEPRAFGAASYRTDQPAGSFLLGALRAAGRARFIVSIILLLVSVVALLLIANQNLGFYLVPSSSMEPTLLPDDRVIAYSSEYYGRGEVVVIRDPDDPDDPAGYLVKRIVGIEGDLVAVRGGNLILNGEPVQEPYLKEPMAYKLGPVRVSPGEIFVLGDNRNQSHDSHIWKGGVPVDTVMGAVRYIYSPRARMGAGISHTEVFADRGPVS